MFNWFRRMCEWWMPSDPDDFEPVDCRCCGLPIEGKVGSAKREREVLAAMHDECVDREINDEQS